MPYRTLTKRSRGEDVRLLQNQLNQLGFRAGPVDGVFGFLTERAVIMFQRAKGLPSDGIVGQVTWGALLRPEEGLAKVIEINLMSFSNYGGRGKALLHAVENMVAVTCWAMPMPSVLGKHPGSERFYETYVVWLANSEENKMQKIGPLALDGLEYKLEATNIGHINDFNFLIVTIEVNDECLVLGGIPILIGSY